MEQIGYSYVVGGAEVAFWGDTEGQCPGLPNPLMLPNGDQVFCADFGRLGDGHFVPRMLTFGETPSIVFDADRVIVTRSLDKHALIAVAAEARWQREQAGFEVNGVSIATNDRSKIMILGAKGLAEQDPSYSTEWALPDGTSVKLDAEQIKAIAIAVGSYVDSCFKLYKTVVDQIAAGGLRTPDQVQAAFDRQ